MAPSFRMTSIAIVLVMLPTEIDCYMKPYHLRIFDMYMSGAAAPTCITLFRDHFYQGPGIVACQSRGLIDLGAINSVRLGPGVARVVFFQHSHWSWRREFGARMILDVDAFWLGENFNETGSFEVIPRVRAGCVMVFVGTHYRGWRKTVCRNEPSFGHGWNDAISSMVVPLDTYVRLYTHHGYRGRSVLVTGDVADFGTFEVDDEISSISFTSFDLVGKW